MTRERVLNRLAEAIRDSGQNIVREEVRVPQRAVVLDTEPLQVELTHARLVLDSEDLIVSQSVRQYENDYGINVGDVLVLVPVQGEEWVAAGVIAEEDEWVPTGGGGVSGERWFSGTGAPPGAMGEIGDWYLEEVTGDFYEKTGASTWIVRGNLQGPTGATGAQGPPGPQGIPGPVVTFTHTQSVLSALWDVVHNLNRFPSVTVVDSGGSEIIGDLLYINANRVTVGFGNPTSGKAYLN